MHFTLNNALILNGITRDLQEVVMQVMLLRVV